MTEQRRDYGFTYAELAVMDWETLKRIVDDRRRGANPPRRFRPMREAEARAVIANAVEQVELGRRGAQ